LLGVDAAIFGAFVGLALIVFVLLILALYKVPPVAMVLAVIAMAAINVLLGAWPVWIAILLAVIGGIMAWREVQGSSAPE